MATTSFGHGRLRRRRTVAGVIAITLLVVSACSDDGANDGDANDGDANDDDDAAGAPAAGDYPESGPPGDPAPTVTRDDVDDAVDALGPVAEEALAETGVPGMSIAVVFDDEVVFTGGYGIREIGTDEEVDADTVFQLASVSKPVGSTVMAALVGDGTIDWDQPVHEVDPGFALADPAITERVTFADLYAHRSGLPDHAGDLLEDLGFTRDEILDRLRHYPLDDFRSTYAYTNFGLTEAAVAAAAEAGEPWEDLSAELLYEPLGMSSTSSRHDDFLAQDDRAVPHVEDDDGTWVAEFQRDADAQTPAGGVSSSARDMAQWLRLQMAEGVYDGEQIVDADALMATHTPHSLSTPPRSPSARSSFYGLGMGVSYDDAGRTRLSHSGAFALGAATSFGILTNDDLGIVVLTNGMPVGLPETVVESFLDLATDGEVSRDWLGLFGEVMAGLFPEPEVDYTTPPDDPTPARDPETYTGTYDSDIYGPLEITDGDEGDLTLTLGPEPLEVALDHYDGDTFWFTPSGENAVNPSGVTFAVDGDDPASSVEVTWLDGETPDLGIGTFTRS